MIASFYLNVLGRPADAAGLAHWTAKLDAKGATPGQVIAEMIDVVANYGGADPAGIQSAALFNNRTAAALYYSEHGGSLSNATQVLAGVTAATDSVAAARAFYLPRDAMGEFDLGGYSSVSIGRLIGDTVLKNVQQGILISVREATSLPWRDDKDNSLRVELADGQGSGDSLDLTFQAAGEVYGAFVFPSLEHLRVATVNKTTEYVSFRVHDTTLQSLTLTGNVKAELVMSNLKVGRIDGGGAAARLYLDVNAGTAVGGPLNDSLAARAAGARLEGGAGEDVFYGYAPGITFVGGPDHDLFNPWTHHSLADLSVVADYTPGLSGDTISLGALVKGAKLEFRASKIVVPGDANLQTYFDQACSVASGGPSVASWFQYEGNTYVVVDNSAAAGFVPDQDFGVKLTGLVNLSTSQVADVYFFSF